MTEHIICGIITVLAIGVIVVVLRAKTKAGWSFIQDEQEDETDV